MDIFSGCGSLCHALGCARLRNRMLGVIHGFSWGVRRSGASGLHEHGPPVRGTGERALVLESNREQVDLFLLERVEVLAVGARQAQ